MRGDQRSRSIESIVQEAHHLAAQGVKEIILISQNTTAYGRDLYGKPCLPSLLRQLALSRGSSGFVSCMPILPMSAMMSLR